MKIMPVFPTPVYIDNFFPTSDLSSFLDALPCDPMLSGDTIHCGVRSTDLDILRKEECNELRQFVLESALNFARNYLGYDIEKLVDVLSWVSKKRTDEEHSFHVHPNSFISGVYYYTTVTRQTPIMFRRPFTNSPNFFEMHVGPQINPPPAASVPFSSPVQSFLPVAGDLVLFPSHLEHCVPRNRSNSTRASLAFNILPANIMGEARLLTQFRYTDVT